MPVPKAWVIEIINNDVESDHLHVDIATPVSEHEAIQRMLHEKRHMLSKAKIGAWRPQL